MIPEGTYRAVAIAQSDDGSYVQWGETKAGKPQVAITFEILNAEEQAEQAGQHIVWFGYFTEKTAARTVEYLRLCGFTGNELSATTTQALTREVALVVKHEEYNGKTTAKVQWINAPGGGNGFKMAKTLDKGALDAFSAKMRSTVAKVKQPEASLPGPTDDDLNF